MLLVVHENIIVLNVILGLEILKNIANEKNFLIIFEHRIMDKTIFFIKHCHFI